VDPANAFYQVLAGTSFTLLGLWFGITNIAHGGWHDDPIRQRATLHIALRFFLPGMAALGSLLSGTTEGGLIWRITFILAGMLGLFESVTFLRAPGRPMSPVGRTLILFDPLFYLAMIAIAFLQPGPTAPLAPLQLEGMATGMLFLLGMVHVWLAYAELKQEKRAVTGLETHGGR
jgi:hypothetical protein